MSMKFSVKKRQALAAMALDELITHCGHLRAQEIGSNYRLILAEFGQRFKIPADAVSLAIIRRNTELEQQNYIIRLWTTYSDYHVTQLRQVEGRKWHRNYKCNSFAVPSPDNPDFISLLRQLFNKSVLIRDNGYEIIEGTAAAKWHEPTLYDLSDRAYSVNLGRVLKGFQSMRPNDAPLTLAIHGDIDQEFRSLFSNRLKADPEILNHFRFRTRHPMILFRFFMEKSAPRYLLFSAERNEPIKVLFGNTKNMSVTLTQLKETQQRLGHPLIEPSSGLSEQLRAYVASASKITRRTRFLLTQEKSILIN